MSDRAAWALRAAKEAGDGILARVRPRPPRPSSPARPPARPPPPPLSAALSAAS